MTKFLATVSTVLCLALAVISHARAKEADAKEKSSFQAAMSTDEKGKATVVNFSASAANIYVVWHGYDLKKGDKVSTVWILEDGGPTMNKNVKVFENTQTAEKPGSNGSFNGTRPGAAWTPGKYRADILVNDKRVQSLKFTIK